MFTGFSSHRYTPSTPNEKISPRVAAIDQVLNNIDSRTRHVSHGENDLAMSRDAREDALAGKATKLNSIANNMTVQAKSSAPRTPLEHSVQNIKHKTPVNQVKEQTGLTNHMNATANIPTNQKSFSRQGSRTSNPDNAALVLERQTNDLERGQGNSLARRQEQSAVIIQRFYRRHVKRKKSGEAALKRMLEGKRKERESSAL